MEKMLMSNLVNHARREFRAAGWMAEDGTFDDDYQKEICKSIIRLLKEFARQGHSGGTAAYTIGIFAKLASFEPLVPLTGEDWEWTDVAEMNSGVPLWQNKRCSHVFKEGDEQAYDIDGKVFWEWWINERGEKTKNFFTAGVDSRVPVVFPYTPTRVYEERVAALDKTETTVTQETV